MIDTKEHRCFRTSIEKRWRKTCYFCRRV